MNRDCENTGLTKGLRALAALTGHAAVDPQGLASAAQLTVGDARVLLEWFEAHGYADRLRGAWFMPTSLARRMVPAVFGVGAGPLQTGLLPH